MQDKITISGETFTVPTRYVAGHVLTAAEATALDQLYQNNLRNNFTKRVTDAQANGGFDLNALQEELDRYATTYEFGKRRTKASTIDPAMVEARKIARQQIRLWVEASGKKLADYKPSAISSLEKKLIDMDPSILRQARVNIEVKKAAAEKDLSDLVSGLPLKATA